MIAKYEDNFFLRPICLNGSAIETLFSQFKYTSGEHLSSANYPHARLAYLMKVEIHGIHHGEDNYRRNSPESASMGYDETVNVKATPG